MKRQFGLNLLLAGAILAAGTGSARGQTYSSYVTATQVHATANHWGNSKSHLLIDTLTVTVPGRRGARLLDARRRVYENPLPDKQL